MSLTASLALAPAYAAVFGYNENAGRNDIPLDACVQVKWTRMKPYRNFVKMVERHWDGILAFCDKKVSLGYIESSDLKVRNVIRKA